MTNKDRINELNTLDLSVFVCICAEIVYRRYLNSLFGFAMWLEQPEDKDFWNDFYKRIEKCELSRYKQ